MVAALSRRLHGRPCQPFNSELRTVIPLLGDACYPDASVVCGPLQTDPRDPNGVINPAVLVEVLSTTTEMYDRGGLVVYLRVGSLDVERHTSDQPPDDPVLRFAEEFLRSFSQIPPEAWARNGIAALQSYLTAWAPGQSALGRRTI